MCVEQKGRERERRIKGGKRWRERREYLAIVWHMKSIGKDERRKV